MIEIELLNIMKKLLENGDDLHLFCKKMIYLIQQQSTAIGGIRVGIETRERIEKAASELITTMREYSLPKIPPGESTLEHSFPDKAP